MKGDPRFLDLGTEFWTAVRLISEQQGYTLRKREGAGPIKVHDRDSLLRFVDASQVEPAAFIKKGALTAIGEKLLEYFEYRADVLNNGVAANLMNLEQARGLYERLVQEYRPKWPVVMNKQKAEKKGPAYLTGIVNILLEHELGNVPCDYNPQRLSYFTKRMILSGMLSRRVDGALPSTVNPMAVWEIKEYYHTKTFGSRVSDGVYESYLDGLELRGIRANLGIQVDHVLVLDDHFTWWVKGRSYLCRIVDMLHMGILSEAIFGKEALTRVPALAREWKLRYETEYHPDGPSV